MNHFVDNDLAIKLAATDLIREVCQLLHLDRSNTRRLPSLRTIALRKIQKEKLHVAVSQRIGRFCDQYEPITEVGDAQVVEQLSSPKIDPGEALLLANAIIDREAVVLTGDKRCVRALATDPNLRSAREALSGRIEILDSIYLRLLDHFGFEYVQERVVKGPSVDGMLDLAFHTEELDKVSHARTALISGEREIESRSPGLLRHP